MKKNNVNQSKSPIQSTIQTIDDYINTRPEKYRATLKQLRSTIHAAAPQAIETIKYAMPTFEYHGHLVYFALCKNHIGFYPMPSGINNFKEKLKQYHCSKGAIQFPLDEALPLPLIGDIVALRVKENEEKARQKLLPKDIKKGQKDTKKNP